MNVVFDFDGTLVDSFNALYALNWSTANTLFGKDLTRDQYRDAFKGPIHKEMSRVLNLNFDEEKMFKNGKRFSFSAFYSPATVQLHEGIIPVLEALNDKTLSISTAAPTEVVWDMLRHYGIDRHFARVFGGEGPSKREVLNQLTAPTLFVTDTVGDVLEAKQTDATIVGVNWGFHRGIDLYEAGAHILVREPSELTRLV